MSLKLILRDMPELKNHRYCAGRETLSFSVTLYYGRSAPRNTQEACNGRRPGQPGGLRDV